MGAVSYQTTEETTNVAAERTGLLAGFRIRDPEEATDDIESEPEPEKPAEEPPKEEEEPGPEDRYNYTVHRTFNVRILVHWLKYLVHSGLPDVRTFINFWPQMYDVRTFFKGQGALTGLLLESKVNPSKRA